MPTHRVAPTPARAQRTWRPTEGFKIPSAAAFGAIGDRLVKEIERFAVQHGMPMVRFKKGENKEEFARPLLEAAAAEGGEGKVVLIGVCQEKASVWRSWKAKGHEHRSHPHMEWGRQMVMVNHYYFYVWDPEWGPAFWKTNAYAPWPIWIYLNGHVRHEAPWNPSGDERAPPPGCRSSLVKLRAA